MPGSLDFDDGHQACWRQWVPAVRREMVRRGIEPICCQAEYHLRPVNGGWGAMVVATVPSGWVDPVGKPNAECLKPDGRRG